MSPREEATSPPPQRFGNYVLLHRLARGGMGEVYVARHGDIAGMQKVCVLKTLRRDVSGNEEYVARFHDEARLVVQLNHRNIGQVFDVGQVDDRFYLGMELISGIDLRSIFDRLGQRGETLDESLALHIVGEVLEALSYAHRLADPTTGEALRVVHRDVSPQNVMVSFEGEVKLIDFGLAASAQKNEHTAVDQVMGKLAYMSPEQARGDDVDGRCDLFATAVVAYELVTGHRYYEGLSKGEVWAVVGKGTWRPPHWESLHKGLRKVLGRALEADLEKRFPDAESLREALDGYVFARGHRAGARELRSFLDQQFDDEKARHRQILSHARQPSDGAPPTDSSPSRPRAAPPGERTASEPRSAGAGAGAPGVDDKGETDETASRPRVEAPPAEPAADATRHEPAAYEADSLEETEHRPRVAAPDVPTDSAPASSSPRVRRALSSTTKPAPPAPATPPPPEATSAPAEPTSSTTTPTAPSRPVPAALARPAGRERTFWLVAGGALVAFVLLLIPLLWLLFADSEEATSQEGAPTAPVDATGPEGKPAGAAAPGSPAPGGVHDDPARADSARPADEGDDDEGDDDDSVQGAASDDVGAHARRGRRAPRSRHPRGDEPRTQLNAPGLAASDREKRAFLREHCAHLPCAQRVLSTREDARMTMEEKREAASALSNCVFVCAKR